MFEQDDDHTQRPSRDWWVDFALEKITSVLIAQELRLEGRNGYFTGIWLVGAASIGGAWWRLASDTGSQWEVVWIAVGAALIVTGVALRINGALELRHIRKLVELASVGKFPD